MNTAAGTATQTFVASRKDGRAVEVQAETFSEAAAMAGHKFYPRNRNLSIMRTTGSPGLSGWFQCYVPIGHEGGLTSYGEPFHVGHGCWASSA